MFSTAFIKSKLTLRLTSFSFISLCGLTVVLCVGLWITPDNLLAFKWCAFQRLLGLDCPGCGLTRAFLLIPRGQWLAAWELNAAALPLYCFFVSVWIMESVKLYTGRMQQVPFYYRVVTPWLMSLLIFWALGHWAWRLYFKG